MASKLESFDSVSEATTEADNANIHGIVASVSPMRKGKRSSYFQATLTDGDAAMRVVGFQPSQREKLETLKEKAEPISLHNCQLKRAWASDDLEILLRSSSTFQHSPKKFKAANIAELGSSNCTVDKIANRTVYDKVSIRAKVVRVDQPVKVSGNLTKQDLALADATGSIKLTLWQDKIGSIEQGTSYHFTNMVVRTYLHTKYLSMPKEGASIDKIEDIGSVADDDLPETDTTIRSAEVIGVASLDNYNACLSCKGKVDGLDDTLGSCTKCSMTQRLNKCKKQLRAKLYISSGEDYFTLQAFGSNVSDIAGKQDVTTHALLHAQPFTLTHDSNVITSVTRP